MIGVVSAVGHGGSYLDLSTGGTFSRGSEASYMTCAPTDGSSSFILWAPTNSRRIEDRGDGLGKSLLLEGQRINYLLNSRDPTGLTAGGWTTGNGGTFTADANGGIDFSGKADQYNNGSGVYGNYQASPGPAGWIAGSCWVRSAVNNVTASHQIMAMHISAGAALAARVLSVGNFFKRNVTSGSATTNSGLEPIDCRDWTSVGGQVAIAQNTYIDGCQLEAGYFPSSVIRTSATAVTRSADSLSYAFGQYPKSFLTAGFSFKVALDASSNDIAVSGITQAIVWVGTNNTVWFVGAGGTCQVELWTGGSRVCLKTITFSRYQPLTISASPSKGTLTILGATTGDGTATGSATTWPNLTMTIGNEVGGTEPMFGRIIGAKIYALREVV